MELLLSYSKPSKWPFHFIPQEPAFISPIACNVNIMSADGVEIMQGGHANSQAISLSLHGVWVDLCLVGSHGAPRRIYHMKNSSFCTCTPSVCITVTS